MKTRRWLMFGLLLLLGGFAHAEGNCPAGYYPIGAPQGQGGPQGCAPIPGDNSQQQVQSQALPPPQWASRWGAIATDKVKGILGAVTGLSSKNEAQQAALADCQAKGGSPCKLEIAYDNECAALVVGDNGYNVGADATLDKVIRLGMKICTGAKNANCHVYYSDCSLPVRIQ